MAFDDDLDVFVLLEPGGDIVEDRDGLFRELVGVEVEEDDALVERLVDLDFLLLDVAYIYGVDLLFGDDDGVADVLDGLDRGDDRHRDVLGLLAEVEAEAEGGAQVHAREAVAVGEGGVAERRGLEVRDDGDLLGDVDRKGDTGTAGDRTLVDLQITGVDVRDEPLERAEERVGVDIVERVLAEVGVDVAGCEALVTGTETGPVVEPLAEIDVHGEAGAVAGVVPGDELAAVEAEVHAAADTGEPVVILLDGRNRRRRILGESRETGTQRNGQCNDFVEFHMLTLL